MSAHACLICHGSVVRLRTDTECSWNRRKLCSWACRDVARRRGKPPKRRTEDLFWEKVDRTGECWIWMAAKWRGYGKFWFSGRHRYAHRIAWELSNGPVPLGLELDHKCRNKACVRPDHLEPVSHAENVRRGNAGKGVHNSRAKLTDADIRQIRLAASRGERVRDLGRLYGIHESHMSRIVSGQKWRHVQ